MRFVGAAEGCRDGAKDGLKDGGSNPDSAAADTADELF